MHKHSAKILDHSIARLKKGESLHSVLSACPAKYRAELAELLSLANLAVTMPKTQVPQPYKRKLFLDHQPKESWLVSVTHVARYTFPAVLATLILALTGTFSAAMSSLPGDTLFPVRRAVESTQLKMAAGPQEKALLQLAIANNRLEDVQKVIAQSDSSEANKQQAVTELKQQTIIALNNVKDVVGAPDPNNSNLVSKAEQLAKDQTKLVAIVDPSSAQKDIAKLENTVSDIKKLFATTNEQDAASIPALEKIEVSGAISGIKSGYSTATITIDENKFDVDLKTVNVIDNDGNALKFSDIALSDTVKITGHINKQSNIADTITLLLKAPEPTPSPTPTPTPSPTTKATDKGDLKPTPSPSVTPSPSPAAVIPVKPADTFTGFIPEGPTAQQ